MERASSLVNPISVFWNRGTWREEEAAEKRLKPVMHEWVRCS